MIEITNKTYCCGCTACKEVCPTNAIEMKEDKQGFLYPLINKDKCIHCNKCNRICPILQPVSEKRFEQKAYLLQHKNKEVLLDSSSGGAFTAIAEYILDLDGVVFGAKYDKYFDVVHGFVEKKEDLSKFRNSKYVQSNMLDNFKLVKDFISQKKYVLFSGTPCQIEGLLNYIGIESEYLFTVDIACHAVPSPAVWRTYLQSLKLHDISNLRFRDKEKYGYLYSQFKIDSSKKIYEGIEKNIMLRAFFSEICNRPSCYECKFKKRYRRSDFTMWDCFDLTEFSKSNLFNQNDGVSRLLVHSLKGQQLINEIRKEVILEEISVDNALHYDAKELFQSVNKHDKYNDFWKAFYNNRENALIEFFSPSLKTKVESLLRKFAYVTGSYPFIRKTYKKLFGNRRR